MLHHPIVCRPFASSFLIEEASIESGSAIEPQKKVTLNLSAYTVPVLRDNDGASIIVRSLNTRQVLEPQSEIVITGTPACEFIFQVPNVDLLPCFLSTMSSSMSEAVGSDVLLRIALNGDIVVESHDKALLRAERIDSNGSSSALTIGCISRNERDRFECAIPIREANGMQALRLYLSCGDQVMLRASPSDP